MRPIFVDRASMEFAYVAYSVDSRYSESRKALGNTVYIVGITVYIVGITVYIVGITVYIALPLFKH